MGILKLAAKTAGTVVLTATGVTSHLANVLVNTCNKDGGDMPLFTAIENSSFDTIKKIWHPDDYEEYVESGEAEVCSLQRSIERKRQSVVFAQNMMHKFQTILEKADSCGTEKAQEEARANYEIWCEKYECLLMEMEELEKELANQPFEQ